MYTLDGKKVLGMATGLGPHVYNSRFHPKSVRTLNVAYEQKLYKIQIYKTMRTLEPAQKSLYKSLSGEDCAYVHLLPDSSHKSPYMELTTPSFTMHNLICITFP